MYCMGFEEAPESDHGLKGEVGHVSVAPLPGLRFENFFVLDPSENSELYSISEVRTLFHLRSQNYIPSGKSELYSI